jgi:hypothetical protein
MHEAEPRIDGAIGIGRIRLRDHQRDLGIHPGGPAGPCPGVYRVVGNDPKIKASLATFSRRVSAGDLSNLLGQKRATEKIALGSRTADFTYRVEYRRVLDPFGHDLQTQLAAQGDDSGG